MDQKQNKTKKYKTSKNRINMILKKSKAGVNIGLCSYLKENRINFD